MIWVALVLVGLLAAGLLYRKLSWDYRDRRIRTFRHWQAWGEYKRSKRQKWRILAAVMLSKRVPNALV